MRGGARTRNSAASNRHDRHQAEILQQEKKRQAGARADPRAACEGGRERDEERRQHQQRPDAIARKQNARAGGAGDEHQQAGIGHVVTERALRPAAEVVEMQDAVLHDAHSRADGADADDHLHDQRGLRTARELVHHRDDEKQHELLRVDEAGARIAREGRRDERDGAVRRKRNEQRRRVEPLAAGDEPQQPHEERERKKMLAMAIENWSAATNPSRPAKPIRCNQSWVEVSARSTAAVAILNLVSASGLDDRRALAASRRRGDRLCRDAGETAEIAGFAAALIARAARQRPHLGRLTNKGRVAPGLGAHGQRRAVESDDRHAGRARDVKRPAVASDVERRPTDQAPAAPPDRTRRWHDGARSGAPRRAAPASAMRVAAPASDGPDVKTMRRRESFDTRRTMRSANDSAGQRRNGFPALT